MKEKWSYYHDTKHQIWLWLAVDHANNTPLAFAFGRRTDDVLCKLLALLEEYNIGKIFTDNNFTYSRIISHEFHYIGKRNTQKIERQHLRTKL